MRCLWDKNSSRRFRWATCPTCSKEAGVSTLPGKYLSVRVRVRVRVAVRDRDRVRVSRVGVGVRVRVRIRVRVGTGRGPQLC